MDRKDYYRILGVRPGSTRTEIDKAYNERMKRLRSLDFEDEREYADRKMRELKYAAGRLRSARIRSVSITSSVRMIWNPRR